VGAEIDQPDITGILFEEQSVDSIVEVLDRFDLQPLILGAFASRP
jgi:hypothetical protein